MGSVLTRGWYRRKRQTYAGGRPNRWGRIQNRWAVKQFALGPLALGRGVVLEVRGRSSGRRVEVPLVVLRENGERYLAVAPGARPHIPVDRRAPASAFQAVAADYPVFRVDPVP